MTRRGRFGLILAIMLALVVPSAVLTPSGIVFRIPQAEAAITGNLISRVYVDKARYNPGNVATITVEALNKTGSTWSGSLALTITHLEATTYTASQSVTLNVNVPATFTFTWTTPATDFQGYHVEVRAGTADYGASAIDVSSTWTRFPRYGYMTEYPTGESNATSIANMQELERNYHINAIQFYDWMYRHEQLIKRTGGTIDSSWTDWSGKTINWTTLQNQINAAHSLNMSAMAYDIIYGGLDNYQATSGVNPQWGLYNDTSHTTQWNFDFGDAFPTTHMYMFNPANSSWQSYISGQYNDALNNGFDGMHLDQLGQNDNKYDYNGQPIDLPNTFAGYVNNVKAAFPAGKKVTYNIVNGGVGTWGAYNVAHFANNDFDYSEQWENSTTYQNLKDEVTSFKALDGNKAVVLAAYMNYYEDNGARTEAETATRNGVTTNTNHTGYTGTGFVDAFDAVGDYVQSSITVPEDGKYALVFRYSNGTTGTPTRTLYVDGANNGALSFYPSRNSGGTPSWDSWLYDAYKVVTLTAGAHTVKLAYDAGNTGAINLDNLVLGTFDEPAVRLAEAAMAAVGATHIELGNRDQMLAHPYFPNNYKQMRSGLRSAMKEYYDFITAYENVLFDPSVHNADNGAQFVKITGQTTSGDGTGGTIWTQLRHAGGYDLINLINLIGNDNQWRNAAAAPTSLSNLPVKYYLGSGTTVSGVYAASPDSEHGTSASLSYTTGSDAGGTYISFTVPSLAYWDLIMVKLSVATPGGGQYEAEGGIRSSTTTNTNRLGYTGSGFVDGFAATNTGVSFIINAPANDSYTLRFRYANGGSSATRGLFVDGAAVGTLSFRPQFNWDMWDTAETTTPLTAGLHSVVLWDGASNTGAINLDNLVVLRQTTPAARSATSLWMNNWSNIVGIHMASKLSPADTGTYGPRLAELHWSGDWGTNQLNDATGFFRDETAAVKYNNAHAFDSEAWMESDGTLTVRYLNYNGAGVPVQITKQYAMVPNQNFVVVKYTFQNLTNSARTFNFLEQAHLSNKTLGNPSPNWQHGWWDSTRNALGSDMSQSGQFYIELGALQTMDSHQVGDDANSTPTNANSAPWYQFDNNGALLNTGDLWSQRLDLGFQKSLALAANGSASLSFYYAIGSTQAAAESAADTARAQTSSYWFTQTGTAYTNWLNTGLRTSLADAGLNTAFDRSLVINKQSQQPAFGSWPAATNPAYAYKVWVRDAAVTAMGMDATGHLSEAEKYWNWMASVQLAGSSGVLSAGNWYTNYSVWQANQSISFVEPEHDAIGLFLIGVYRHYNAVKATNPSAATTFLSGIWTQVTRAGDFIKNNIGSNGFGPYDASIWEESPLEYNTFTQVTYAAGLNAAKYLATEKADTTRATNYLAGAQTIRNAMIRSSLASPYRGLWNDSNRYFNRAVNTDGTARTLVDSSSDLLWVFGVLPASDGKVLDHRIKVLSTLSHDSWGIPRYQGDEFYHSSIYSPGGVNEASAAEPVWPQMVMYTAMQEHWTGNDTWALARLQWYASRTGRGFVTPGEAVDWTNGQPLISTAAEPVTGAWYQMATLVYLNQYDPRLPAIP
ncbi:MAG: glycoside hydrolase family 66 protein [Roseiflexaceae bacterium]